MHLDAGQIQQVLHGELQGGGEAWIRSHLESCEVCQGALTSAEEEEREIEALLAAVDHPQPSVDRAIEEASARRPRRSGRGLRWAAGLAIGFGISAAAYAAPNSPVPGWVSSLLQRTTGDRPGAGQVAELEEALAGGVRIAPGERFVIRVDGVLEGAHARVTLVAGGEVQVSGGPGPGRFLVGSEGVGIQGMGADTVDIGLPEAAPFVELRVEDRTVLVKEGAVLRVGADELAGPGPFLVPLPPPDQ